jgi:hypothetical protein
VPDAVRILVIFAAFAAVMVGLPWLTSRSRGRRVGGSVAGPFEEIWHPAAHRARIEIEVQDERSMPMPSPGDTFRFNTVTGSQNIAPAEGRSDRDR